jgi:hypothetical protein
MGLLLLGALWTTPTEATIGTEDSVSLQTFLNRDGFLQIPAGFTGSIDPTGFQLVSGANAAPRFAHVPQSPTAGVDDANWDSRLSTLGTNGAVRGMLWDGTYLYIGGSFTQVGGVPANFVARWDGRSWSALGSGTNNAVWTFASDGTNLYVGGTFTAAGGSPANRIARWNGSTWSNLGTGLGPAGSVVFSLVWEGSNLYAGGSFTTAGGSPANRVARWNGSSWSALAGGGFTNGAVRALAWDGSNLYAGGTFNTPISSIARWDGTAWNTLGTGVNNNVFALAWDGSGLFAGGNFTTAGGSPASRVARWDGANWSALGGGVNGAVQALAWTGSNLYVTGGFTSPGSRIAMWDGSAWNTLGSGLNNTGFALAWDEDSLVDSLYVGGDFTTAGTYAAPRVARWRLAAIWDGGGADNNASTAANWSGDVAPVATDVAVFDSTSNKDATLDGAFTTALVGLLVEDTYTGTITQANNLAISEDLEIHAGTLIVADPAVNTLTVGGTMLNTGATLLQTRPVNNADVAFLEIDDGSGNVKYRGAEIDTTGTGANLGNVTADIRVIDTVAGEYCTGQGSDSFRYVRRCYEITATTDGAANVQLWYLFTERNGINVGNMGVYRDTNGGGNWVLLANRTTGNDGASYRYATGDTPGFSHFLVGHHLYTPTAVTLQTFTSDNNTAVPILMGGLVLLLFIVSVAILIRQRRMG